jgi:MFS family permease
VSNRAGRQHGEFRWTLAETGCHHAGVDADDQASPPPSVPATGGQAPGSEGRAGQAGVDIGPAGTPSRVGPDPVAAAEPATGGAGAAGAGLGGRPRRGRRRRGWLRVATVDLGPLRRHRDFRLLFAGRAVSFAGSMITYVAIPYQVFQLTGSSLMVGLLGVAELTPLLATALLGGALADARDRRRMVQLTELGLAVLSGVLVVNAAVASPRVWVLFVVAALAAALDGLQRPSLDAMMPRLVERHEIPAATAISSMLQQFGMVGGPTLGGLLIARFGLAATYGVDLVSFMVSLVALSFMRALPPPAGAQRPSLRGVLQGLRYARSRQELLGSYVVDIVAMVFGMPTALFPAIAARYGGAGALGLLYAAPSVGAFLANATSGWTGGVRRHGRAILVAAAAWGAAIAGFGVAGPLWLALGLLAVAGAADMVSGIFRSTIWNQTIPDHLRGRLAGIELLSYSSGPLLGNVEAGAVASLFSVRVSVVSGGLLSVLGVGIVALALPAFRTYDARRWAPPERDAPVSGTA